MNTKLKEAFSLVLPVVLTYIPIGATYGVLAQNSGLGFGLTMLMSVLIYAGTSQLVAVGLIATGHSALSIAISVFIINSRHLLYSSVMVRYVNKLPLLKKILFALQITDETFIIQSSSLSPEGKDYEKLFFINIIAHGSWILGTFLGFTLGQESFDFSQYGGNFALLAMLAALLVLSIKKKAHLILAILSCLAAVFFKASHVGQFSVMLAAVMVAFLGTRFKKWII